MHARLTQHLRDRAALYAVGALDIAERAAFEQHLADGCPACQDEVASFGVVTDHLALVAEPVPPAPAVRARVLAAAQSGQPTPFPFVRRDEGSWREIAPGVTQKILAGSPGSGAISYLLRMTHGAIVPRHVHDSVEHCYVVEGAVRINGRRFEAGDFTLAGHGSEHDESTTDTGCLLLIVESRPEGRP